MHFEQVQASQHFLSGPQLHSRQLQPSAPQAHLTPHLHLSQHLPSHLQQQSLQQAQPQSQDLQADPQSQDLHSCFLQQGQPRPRQIKPAAKIPASDPRNAPIKHFMAILLS
jgi:hypothetical protein